MSRTGLIDQTERLVPLLVQEEEEQELQVELQWLRPHPDVPKETDPEQPVEPALDALVAEE